ASCHSSDFLASSTRSSAANCASIRLSASRPSAESRSASARTGAEAAGGGAGASCDPNHHSLAVTAGASTAGSGTAAAGLCPGGFGFGPGGLLGLVLGDDLFDLGRAAAGRQFLEPCVGRVAVGPGGRQPALRRLQFCSLQPDPVEPAVALHPDHREPPACL